MTDTTQDSPQPGFDRRRFIKASAGGAALVWAAPTITGLDARAFAAGSDPNCIQALSDNFDSEPTTPDSGGYSTQTSLNNFVATTGNVDVIGYAAPYIYFGGGEGRYIDLLGTGGGSTTVLESKADVCAGTYSITIRYSDDPRGIGSGSITVALAGVTLGVIPSPAGSSTSSPQTVTFPATSAADGKLTISATSSDGNNGPILLGVSIS